MKSIRWFFERLGRPGGLFGWVGRIVMVLTILGLWMCKRNEPEPMRPVATEAEGRLERERAQMINTLRRHGFNDEAILAVMERVPRHAFVPADMQSHAYEDSPLPIGHGQTISQPYIVAEMTRQLQLTSGSRVLEIGTGSGYQAAILAEITPHVYTIEIVEALGLEARERFETLGYDSIQTRIGDGYAGWPEVAPFDGIIVTCAPDAPPPPLLEQLAPGGRMIIPVGGTWGAQSLELIEKDPDGALRRRSLMGVRFVPFVRSEE